MINFYPQNLHTHSTFDDGRDSCESTIQRAIELGFDSIGFSGHSYMPYSPSYSMSPETTLDYKKEVCRLKEKYAGVIDVYCGIEFDMYSTDPLEGYEYIIGSLHYLLLDGEHVGFDRSAEEVKRIIDTHFHGDSLAFARAHFESLAQMPKYCRCDIVGHMDLLAKHNETMHFFDTESKEYRRYALEAIDVLCRDVGIFEINTGCIPRGYRKNPYPDPFLLKSIRERGGSIVISSDCHDNRYLNHGFADALELARRCGFKEVLKLSGQGFVPCPLY